MVDLDWLGDEQAARQIAWALEDVPDADNRALLETYLKERYVNGISPKTLKNDVHALRDLAKDLGEIAFEDAEKVHVFDHFADPTRTRKWRHETKDGYTTTTREVELSDNTLAVRKQTVRKFYKWLTEGDDYPAPVKDLKPRRRDEDKIPTDQLIDREDLDELINAHHQVRDRALIAVLFESGLRAGELVALNLDSVTLDEYGAILLIPKDAPGLKTGSRRVRLVDSASYLQAWIEAHPDQDNPDAPLFISLSTKNRGERLTTGALWRFCKRAGNKAGLDKDLHPHLFRHSAATEKARQGWTEAEMRAYFGWSRTSDMPAKYNHLAGQDYDEMMLERLGVKEQAEEDARALAPRICPDCKAENLPSSDFCQECRAPISPDAEERIQEEKDEELMERVAERIGSELKDEIAAQVREELTTDAS